MKKNKEKSFYGLINFVRAIRKPIIILILGIIVWLLFSFLIGFIIICIAAYSTLSYLVSIYSVRPTRSLDLSDFLKLDGNEKVLDAGCGLGRATVGVAKLLKTGKVIGIDIWDTLEVPGNSPEKAYKNAEIEGVRDRVEFRNGDVFDLSFKDKYFDKVYAIHVIEHVLEIKKVFQEVCRVLKPGGKFLVIFPLELFRGMRALKESVSLSKNPFAHARELHLHKLTPRKIRKIIKNIPFKIVKSAVKFTILPDYLMILQKKQRNKQNGINNIGKN